MSNLIGPTIPEEYTAAMQTESGGTGGSGEGPQQQQQLGHEEVWDDSALIDSWEEAVSEYKKYHSIKATGEDPEAIIKAALEEEETPKISAPSHAAPKVGVKSDIEKAVTAAAPTMEDDGSGGSGRALVGLAGVETPADAKVVEGAQLLDEDHYSPPEEMGADEVMEEPENTNIVIPEIPQPILQQQAQQVQPPSIPEALAQASVGNDALRNLMMAWYWAGYYTGLQEGQAQAQAQVVAGRAPTS